MEKGVKGKNTQENNQQQWKLIMWSQKQTVKQNAHMRGEITNKTGKRLSITFINIDKHIYVVLLDADTTDADFSVTTVKFFVHFVFFGIFGVCVL